jgi:hypothetical protein
MFVFGKITVISFKITVINVTLVYFIMHHSIILGLEKRSRIWFRLFRSQVRIFSSIARRRALVSIS